LEVRVRVKVRVRGSALRGGDARAAGRAQRQPLSQRAEGGVGGGVRVALVAHLVRVGVRVRVVRCRVRVRLTLTLTLTLSLALALTPTLTLPLTLTTGGLVKNWRKREKLSCIEMSTYDASISAFHPVLTAASRAPPAGTHSRSQGAYQKLQ